MSIKKNFIYNLAYQMLVIIIPLITTPYVSRVIGADGIGTQAYTVSIANYFVIFSILGINNYGSRSIAMVRNDKNRLSKTFLGIYLFQLFISVITVIIYLIYVLLFVNTNKLFFIIQIIYLVSAMLDINWFFFGIEEFKLTVVRNSIIKILSVISIFIFVKSSSDIYIYSLILALGNLISQLVLWGFIKKHIKFTYVSIDDIKSHIKPIFILFIPVLAVSIYKIMDKIMLGSLSNMTQVGYFENSEKIINIPMAIITALATVMLPRMSNLQANGEQEKSEKYIEFSLEFVMFIGFGAMFGLIGVSPNLIPIFLGDKFIECIAIVSLMSIVIVFAGWANVIRTQFLIPNKMDKVYIISTTLGASVNLLFNLLLIGKFGAIGATISTIMAEAIVAIYQTIKVRNYLDILNYIKRIIFYIIPGVIMYLSIHFIGDILGNSIISGIIQLILGAIIYITVSLVYFIVTKNNIVLNIIRKINNKIIKIIS
ncbi:MAG: oligosaccharide flippase family protein [Clostridium celatum]|nr:oligosaccharide flippase family protein [Clostridium celatum]